MQLPLEQLTGVFARKVFVKCHETRGLEAREMSTKVLLDVRRGDAPAFLRLDRRSHTFAELLSSTASANVTPSLEADSANAGLPARRRRKSRTRPTVARPLSRWRR